MRVGILDILGPPARRPVDIGYQLLITKQYASIMPQAIAVWCRRQGHETFYATYYGLGEPHRLLPADLDVVFISCLHAGEPLAYALAKLYRRGRDPHRHRRAARQGVPAWTACASSTWSSRECDPDAGRATSSPGSTTRATSSPPPGPWTTCRPSRSGCPRSAPRRSSAGRDHCRVDRAACSPALGCPYRCDFCIDWSSTYRPLPARAARDRPALPLPAPAGQADRVPRPELRGEVRRRSSTTLEAQPRHARPPYIIESSLTVLRGDAAARGSSDDQLRDGRARRRVVDRLLEQGGRRPRSAATAKVDRVVEHFTRARRERALPAGELHLRARQRPGRRADRAHQAVHGPRRRSSGRRSTSRSPSAARPCTTSSPPTAAS